MANSEFSSSSIKGSDRFSDQADVSSHEVAMTSDLVLRLVELESQTERAAQLTEDGSYKSAMASWSRVALLAESIFGRVDESALDAKRILASIMSRLGLHDDGLHVLGEIAEHVYDAGLGQSTRFMKIKMQIQDLQARKLAKPSPEVAAFSSANRICV
jgi:hypothetical protein